MNRVLLTVLILAVIGSVWWVAGIFTRRKIIETQAEIKGWDDWPVDRRAACARQLILKLVNTDADRSRRVATFVAATVVVGTIGLISIQNTSNDVRTLAQNNCETAAGFRELQARRITEEIRVTQGLRDKLADRLANATGSLENAPGFDQLPSSVRTFVTSFTAASRQQSQTQLATYDDELDRLRQEADAVRQFNADANCPS